MNRKIAQRIDCACDLVETVVHYHTAMTLRAESLAPNDDLKPDASRPDMLRLALLLLCEYGEWMEFASMAESLAACITELATLMPCPLCGEVLTEDGCGNCGITLDDLSTLSTRSLSFDAQGHVVTLFGIVRRGTPEFDDLLRRCDCAFVDRWMSLARGAF